LSIVGWVFIGIGAFLLILFTSLSIIFYRKMVTQRVTKAYIINQDNDLKILSLKNLKGDFKDGDCNYVYDKKAVLKKLFQDHIFYFKNNPKPILFNSKEQKIEMTATNLGNIIQNSLIDKLFGNKFSDMFSPQMLVTYGILAGVIILVIMNLQNTGDVTLLANNQTINTIAKGVRTAIGG